MSMPWKERSVVDERMRFVLRLKDGESMASLCREFAISRVTGYKIYDRYKECGLEGLTDRKCPVEVYRPSTRQYRGIGELSYPFHHRTALVTYCGRICIFKKKINLGTSLAGQAVGIKEVDEGIWLVSFMDYDLGYIDLEEKPGSH
jgi:Helix-turn-helix domain